MRTWAAGLIVLLWQSDALAQADAGIHAHYATYAAGFKVADVDAGFNLGRSAYRVTLAYRTTGMAGVFFQGHQSSTATGQWRGMQAVPSRFFGEGIWHGEQRLTDIQYVDGKPLIRKLQPPNVNEREAVPDALQAETMDSLTALANLIHVVSATGRCELTVRTFDGRRAVEIEAHTIGEEILEPTSRSAFAGKGLRCDFSGRLRAGFKFGDDPVREGKPLHGSAWLARVLPGTPPLPVRMSFETRWFGNAMMYLTTVGPDADVTLARRQ